MSSGAALITIADSDNSIIYVPGANACVDAAYVKSHKDANVAQLEGVPGASATNEGCKGFRNLADKDLKIVSSKSAEFDYFAGKTVDAKIASPLKLIVK